MAKRVGFTDILAGALRGTYRRLAVDLGGPARAVTLGAGRASEIAALPLPLGTGDPQQGLKILDGRFTLGSQSLDIGRQGDPWSNAAPSETFAARLHRFDWLTDLAAAAGDKKLAKNNPQIAQEAGIRARYLADRWASLFGKWNPYAWSDDILPHRIFAWLTHWQALLGGDQDTAPGAARRSNLMRQIKRLRRTYGRTPDGISRLKAAACLVLGAVCFDAKQSGHFDRGLDHLDDEIEKQILSDGGHISRSPAQAVKALEILIVTESALEAAGVQGSTEIRRAIDRLTPMVSFFSAADGHLFSFHGGGKGRPALHKKLLAQAQINAKQFGYAPHTKYQRLEKNGTVIMIDVGASPPRPFDLESHLAPLAFEMATDAGWLIVNCGWNADQPQYWRAPMRETAAHSALTLGDHSAGKIMQSGIGRRVLGAAVQQGAGPVSCTRKEQENGTWLEANHEAYRKAFGLSHNRRLYPDVLGADIRGEDSLSLPLGAAPLTSEEIPFEIRFHLHPDVKVTLAQNHQSALLIQPGGKGWRFRTDGGPLHLEKSVYLASGSRPRRSEQLVIYGRAYGDGDGQARSNRVRWSLKRMSETGRAG